jgi:hypothetical protein
MRRLRSTHAEDVGGFIVEPGQEFDETQADSETVERLQNEGKLATTDKSARKPKSEGE